jgi:hypothetical protein
MERKVERYAPAVRAMNRIQIRKARTIHHQAKGVVECLTVGMIALPTDRMQGDKSYLNTTRRSSNGES